MVVPRRKSWDDLSPNYRKRLARSGITAEQYNSGTANLAKARGHSSTAKENARRRELRSIRRAAKEYAEKYYLNEAEVYAELRKLSEAEALEHIREQIEAEEAYDQGQTSKATHIYTNNRSKDPSPEWMFYYHGYFH